MTDRIRVDGRQPAALRDPVRTQKFETLAQAVMHWKELPLGERDRTVLVGKGNAVYQPPEIDLLDFEQS